MGSRPRAMTMPKVRGPKPTKAVETAPEAAAPRSAGSVAPPGFFSQPHTCAAAGTSREHAGTSTPTPLTGELPVRSLVSSLRARLESSRVIDNPPPPPAPSGSMQLGQGTPAAAAEDLSSPGLGPSPPGQVGVGSDGSPESQCQFLELSLMSLGEGGPIHEAPRLANRLLQSTVAELEKSRNLSRDIKETILAGLRGLYEMVLRLTDSRGRHIAEKERARASAERHNALQQKIHAGKLEAINSYVQTNLEELRRAGARALDEAEATRRLLHDLKDELIARPPPTAAAPAQDTIDRLLHEVRALREECQRPGPAPAADGGGAAAAAEGAARRGAGSYAAAVGRYPIIVESSDPAHTADQIIGAIKDGVDVISMGVGVNGVRKCKNARVAISLESEEERAAMGSAISGLGDRFTVSSPRARDPCLRLAGVIADLCDAKVEEALLRQNASLLRHIPENERTVKVIRRVRGRSSALNGVIVQVSPAVWDALRERRVRVGYQMISAVDQSPLIQCYRCLGFGHRAGVCSAPQPACGHCAGAHDTRACAARDRPPVCTNCRARRPSASHSHPAYSADCPEWRRWDGIARLAVRYC